MSMATAMLAIKPVSPLIHQSRRPRLNHHHTTPTPLHRVLTHLPPSLTSVAAPSAAKSPWTSSIRSCQLKRPRLRRARGTPTLLSSTLNSVASSIEAGRPLVRPQGYTDQVKSPQDFFTGRLGNVEFVVCRDGNGKIHAFHNVCRHHASLLASGTGRKRTYLAFFLRGCTYALDGPLLRATRIKGIWNFDVKEFELLLLTIATWGPFVLLNFEKDVSPDLEVESDIAAKEWTGSCIDILGNNSIDPSLTYHCRRE